MTETTSEYSRELDPVPGCRNCLTPLEYQGNAEFRCHDCGERFGLIEIYNWCGKRCVVCGKRDNYLSTVLACFHTESSAFTLAFPICGPCCSHSPDTIIEHLQEIKEYQALVDGGLEIGPHPKSGRLQRGGLIIFD